jgi:hypothetical protein
MFRMRTRVHRVTATPSLRAAARAALARALASASRAMYARRA